VELAHDGQQRGHLRQQVPGQVRGLHASGEVLLLACAEGQALTRRIRARASEMDLARAHQCTSMPMNSTANLHSS
jgi:hypothetical protein